MLFPLSIGGEMGSTESRALVRNAGRLSARKPEAAKFTADNNGYASSGLRAAGSRRCSPMAAGRAYLCGLRSSRFAELSDAPNFKSAGRRGKPVVGVRRRDQLAGISVYVAECRKVFGRGSFPRLHQKFPFRISHAKRGCFFVVRILYAILPIIGMLKPLSHAIRQRNAAKQKSGIAPVRICNGFSQLKAG